MTLESGTRLGPYEIETPIGAGGMGEVYRAKDTRLDRTVALKVVVTVAADDAKFKDRFEREARAVSSLNHPNICTLHEFDSVDGVDFLVMELLEGETLAKRLERGPLTEKEAIGYGAQIANALDAAHRRGIVHRDLKPGNIMLTPTGAKLLDFGLAKLEPGKGNVDLSELSALPTQGQPLTQEGAILGTFQYMPPEQLEGREATARTDIFAFGAILYEMLTGKKAFEGKSQAGVIGAILEREPIPLASVRPGTKPALARIIAKCLAKNPDERWGTARDLADELRWVGEGGDEPAASDVQRGVPRWAVAVVALLVGAVLAGILLQSSAPARSSELVTRFPVLLESGQQLRGTLGAFNLAISPTGSHIAYVTLDGLYIRATDQLSARRVSGTDESINAPVFSPDGAWLAYWMDGELKKSRVDAGAGAPVTIGTAPNPTGALSWGVDDVIRRARTRDGIAQIPSGGGVLERVGVVSEDELIFGASQLLPDGETLLFCLWLNGATKVVARAPGGAVGPPIVDGGPAFFHAPSGYLVYWVPPGEIHAAPFDPGRLEITGPAVAVASNVKSNNFVLSQDGSLLSVPGTTAGAVSTLVWVDRDGDVSLAFRDEQVFSRPRLSPDGSRVAVGVESIDPDIDVWIYDLERNTRFRLTPTDSRDRDAIWTPDGNTIVFASNVGGYNQLYRKRSDGSGDAEPMLDTGEAAEAHSFSPDGDVLAYYQRGVGSARRDIWTLSLDGSSDPEPFLQTTFNERSPSFSPDGRFIAYASDESGRDEIYVQPYPGPGRRTIVSSEGGREPVWSPQGGELFYRRGNEIWAAAVSLGATFEAEPPTKLFEGRFLAERPDSGSQSYDVSPDGQRFLFVQPTDQRIQIHVTLNWIEEVKRRFAP